MINFMERLFRVEINVYLAASSVTFLALLGARFGALNKVMLKI